MHGALGHASLHRSRSSERSRSCCGTDAHRDLGQLEPSRLSRRALSHSSARTWLAQAPTFPPPGSRDTNSPDWKLFFPLFFFFLLYQDLAEIDRVLSEWVMFAQRFVNATPYVRAQVCSRGLPGQHACALPSAIRAPRASREHQLPSLKVH